jgi:hypothetical protein
VSREAAPRVRQRLADGLHAAAAPAILLLASCAQAPYVPSATEPTPGLPVAEYEAAVRPGDTLYRIDDGASRILFRVGRAGPMQEMGHDHVVASEAVEGIVLLASDPGRSRADLRIPLRELVVDKPAYRARYGLEPDVPADAVNGTTRNMQEGVLESDEFPWAEVAVRMASALNEPPTLAVSITLHGSTFEYLVPAAIETSGGTLLINGEMTLAHADFGLEPFSAAGGLLRVAENIGVEFKLQARAVKAAELAAM